ncbi:hypothetical protein ACFQ1S_10655 [Kibdelosporangium lantanae]|uniref:Uncharacterized protein n=1 Tax=Kibdelosporangium lantanae TaxID=1497396 RepID=A0ABW3M8V2_9PSEU
MTTDEVKAMNRAPEAVDKAVDKAVDTVRRAEHMLVTGAEDVAARTRKTRRKLARKAKATQKDLRKSARKARGSIQENLQELTGKPKRRRRWPWILGLLGTLCVLVPASPAPAMVIITTALSVAIAVPAPLSVGVLVLLPLVHVVHIGSAVAAVIPGTARVHLAALRPAMIRFVAVQLGTFALAGIAALVPNATTPTVFEVVGLLGAAVLALIAARLIMKRPL